MQLLFLDCAEYILIFKQKKGKLTYLVIGAAQ